MVTEDPKSHPKQNASATVQALLRQAGKAPNPPAKGYRVGAISLLAGVRALAAIEDDFDIWISCHVLAAFVIECALKSFLALNGVDNKALANTYKHNLVRLWEEASKRGLDISSEAPWECKVLSELSTGPLFFIRYRAGANGALLIPGRLLLSLAEDLQKRTEAAFANAAVV